MYAALLERVAEDVRAGGPCLAAMPPRAHRSRMIPPLLLLAAIHRLVIEGQAPEAARFYPSMGGQSDVDALWPHFLTAVPRAVLPPCVQTNEVERSRAFLPGFAQVAERTGVPLRLLEIGTSAGLNLRWDHLPFLDVPSGIRVIERRGCDLNPIDPAREDSRIALLSFVWADQTARMKQLSEVIDIARRVPATVDQCDAEDWLRIQLAEPHPGAATVVFHSIVMPYLTDEGRENVRRVIEEAGGRATADAPLAWLSMEPGADQADIHLTIWPGGERRLIARSSFHGRDVALVTE